MSPSDANWFATFKKEYQNWLECRSAKIDLEPIILAVGDRPNDPPTWTLVAAHLYASRAKGASKYGLSPVLKGRALDAAIWHLFEAESIAHEAGALKGHRPNLASAIREGLQDLTDLERTATRNPNAEIAMENRTVRRAWDAEQRSTLASGADPEEPHFISGYVNTPRIIRMNALYNDLELGLSFSHLRLWELLRQ